MNYELLWYGLLLNMRRRVCGGRVMKCGYEFGWFSSRKVNGVLVFLLMEEMV